VCPGGGTFCGTDSAGRAICCSAPTPTCNNGVCE
jgi:hypothetical protein